MASAISYEMVARVCEELFAAGENPTYLKLHERLGQGSTRVVSAHLRRWRETRAGGADALFAAWPETLRNRAQGLFEALRELSAEAAAVGIAAAQAQMAQHEAELQALVAAAEAARNAALDTLRDEQASVSRLQGELDSVRGTVAAQRAGIDDLLAQREGMIARHAQLEQRCEDLKREHENQVRDLDERAALERARLGEELRSERERLGGELRTERERAAGEREHLMRQTDQLRQDYAAQAQDLRAKLAGLEQREAKQRQRAETAEGQIRDQLATLRQNEALIAELGQRCEQAQGEAASLREACSLERTRVGALEARLLLQESVSAREIERATLAEARLQQLTLQTLAEGAEARVKPKTD